MLLSLALTLLLQSTPALGGLDPVELSLGDKVPGKESLEVRWGRHTYRFGGESTRDAFLADPEQWGIQWGGACGRMGPLSGRGDQERYAVVNGKIFLFASDGCRATFLKGTERFAVDVEMDWPAGRTALAEGRNWIEKAAKAHGAEVFDTKAAVRLGRSSESGGWGQREELLLGRNGAVRRSSAYWSSEAGPGSAVETAWVLGDKPFTVEDGHAFDLLTAGEREDVRRYAHRQPLYLLWSRNQPGFRVARFEARPGDEFVRLAVEFQGLVTELLLDPGTAEVKGLYWLGRLASGEVQDIEERFSGDERVEGVLVIRQRKIVRDLEEVRSTLETWERVEFLEAFPAATLVRPG